MESFLGLAPCHFQPQAQNSIVMASAHVVGSVINSTAESGILACVRISFHGINMSPSNLSFMITWKRVTLSFVLWPIETGHC